MLPTHFPLYICMFYMHHVKKRRKEGRKAGTEWMYSWSILLPTIILTLFYTTFPHLSDSVHVSLSCLLTAAFY